MKVGESRLYLAILEEDLPEYLNDGWEYAGVMIPSLGGWKSVWVEKKINNHGTGDES